MVIDRKCDRKCDVILGDVISGDVIAYVRAYVLRGYKGTGVVFIFTDRSQLVHSDGSLR